MGLAIVAAGIFVAVIFIRGWIDVWGLSASAAFVIVSVIAAVAFRLRRYWK